MPQGIYTRRPVYTVIESSICSVDDCERWSRARGMCHKHYQRWYKRGHTEATSLVGVPWQERFWHYADKRGPDECWPWTGCIAYGYGRFQTPTLGQMAHRVAYNLLVGPIPEGLTLDHLCRNTRCVNPAHLEPVTLSENLSRNGWLTTHCVNGHPWTEENTRFQGRQRSRPTRVCRICESQRWQRRKHQRRKS